MGFPPGRHTESTPRAYNSTDITHTYIGARMAVRWGRSGAVVGSQNIAYASRWRAGDVELVATFCSFVVGGVVLWGRAYYGGR